ncbi:hypothetical protein RHSIM_Rhsim09G0106000 [Rhododendron simsii]|uniref:DUF1639 family protein n=1 Tax=Rhododendron simsii TaxID=118357 RepID=A0A834GF79_RHOSS|nr:hypothetical protein RHSIM_Rhsim09G0106000 [Rhododendron simsii]
MVDLGKRRRERETEKEESMEIMGAAAERSRPSLHNFKMPCLQWGNQKLLRCMNVNQSGGVLNKSAALGASKGSIERKEERLRKSRAAEGDGIEAIREKLMVDLQEAADKMKDAILREGLEAPAPADAGDDSVRPWNLRTRRAACKAPNVTNGVNGSNGGVAKGLKPNFSPLRSEGKSSRLCGDITAEGPTDEKKRERSRFSVSLSRREIEEDFRAMTEHRPPRRPKKRPKIVQKELDTIFPGLWLTEITADIYKVPDAPETGKVNYSTLGSSWFGVAAVSGSLEIEGLSAC